MKKYISCALTVMMLAASMPVTINTVTAETVKESAGIEEESSENETTECEEFTETSEPQAPSQVQESQKAGIQPEDTDSYEPSEEEILEALDYGAEEEDYCNPDELVESLPSFQFISLVVQAEDVESLSLGYADNPWKIGAASKDNVIAYVDEDFTTLIIDGTGAMKTYYKAGDDMVRPREWEKKHITKVIVKSGVTATGGYCFANMPYLEEVVFEGASTKINAGAFQGSAKLKSVTLPGKLSIINGSTFFGCTSLKNIDFPDALTSIKISAFRDSGLEEVHLKKADGTASKIKTIETWAFRGTALKEVTIPAGLRTVGNSVFLECLDLKTVYVDEGVTAIPFELFARCPKLERVYLPHSLEEIEEAAFLKKKPDDTMKNHESETESLQRELYIPVKELHFEGDPDEWKALSKGINNDELEAATLFYKVRITSEEMFMDYMKRNASGDIFSTTEFYLEADIDLKDYQIDDSTVSLSMGGIFSGVLDGQGHRIRNLSISLTKQGKRVGLFQTLKNATVRNLIFEDANISSNGVGCGVLAGYTEGNITAENVTVVSGRVQGSENAFAGGLIGYIGGSDKDSITFSNCSNGADVTAEQHAGGMLGVLSYGAQIKGIVNNGAVVTEKGDAGGIVGYVHMGPVTYEHCENNGVITAKKQSAGGICGSTNDNTRDEHFTFDYCKNTGKITGGTYDTGGIVGFIKSDNELQLFRFNENSGTVTSAGHTGGIIGYTRGGAEDFFKNSNTGVITSTGKDKDAGGLIGGIDDDHFYISRCTNAGDVSAVRRAGGIVGYAGNDGRDNQQRILYCENSGNITSEKHDAAGIIASLATDNLDHVVYSNTNHGVIKGYESVGGIIGYMEGGCTSLSRNVNDNDITAVFGNAGGIVGTIEDDPVTFTKNSVEGTITGAQHSGKICGYDGRKKASVNNDSVLAGSVFGDSHGWLILSGIVIAIAGAAAVIISCRKGKKENERNKAV